MSIYRTACLILVFLVTTSAHGLVNGEAPAKDDKRFDAVAAFSRTEWLVKDDKDKHVHHWVGNGVLIAPDVVLIARHLLAKPIARGERQVPGKYSVRFRRHKNGSLGSKQRGSNSYHQLTVRHIVPAKHTDLALCILEEPVTHIEPVRIQLDDLEPFAKRRCLLAAWGSESPWRGLRNPRVGLKIGENTASREKGHIIGIDSYKIEPRDHDSGKKMAYIIDENAVPNQSDSGGSLFLFDEEGKPVLVGIIVTYTGAVYIPGQAKPDFPLKAAVKGGKQLLEAIEANAKEQ